MSESNHREKYSSIEPKEMEESYERETFDQQIEPDALQESNLTHSIKSTKTGLEETSQMMSQK